MNSDHRGRFERPLGHAIEQGTTAEQAADGEEPGAGTGCNYNATRGDLIAEYVLSNQRYFHTAYLIWNRHIYCGGWPRHRPESLEQRGRGR